VLSQLYILAKAPPADVDADVWEQWARERRPSLDAEDLQRRLLAHGRSSLKSAEARGDEECLWSPFTLERGTSHSPPVGSSFAASEEVQLIHLRFFSRLRSVDI